MCMESIKSEFHYINLLTLRLISFDDSWKKREVLPFVFLQTACSVISVTSSLGSLTSGPVVPPFPRYCPAPFNPCTLVSKP